MEAANESIVEVTQRICDLYHDGIDVGKAVELLKDQEISSKLVRDIYHQLSTNAKKLMRNRLHYYTIGAENYLNHSDVGCWTSRYLIIYSKWSCDSAFHKIKIIDSFNNKSIKVDVKKNAIVLAKIISLKDDFGLLNEEGKGNSFISLISLDLHQRSLKKLHTIEYSSHYIDIAVDKADLTTFLLSDGKSTQICKIVEKNLIIGNVVEIKCFPNYFYDKCAYWLYWNYKNNKEMIQFDTYNVEETTTNRFYIDIPGGYTTNPESIGLVRDNLFVTLRCEDNICSIGCINLKTHQWNILEFSLSFPIRGIYGSEEGSLIFYAELNNSNEDSFYKIPFGKPDLLENTAWLSLVKAMKKREKIKDPYKAARNYLPPNSAINCPFDRLGEDEPEEKLIKFFM